MNVKKAYPNLLLIDNFYNKKTDEKTPLNGFPMWRICLSEKNFFNFETNFKSLSSSTVTQKGFENKYPIAIVKQMK